MSEEDKKKSMKDELWRATSPEYRMLELIEKLNERVESNDKESQRKMEFIVNQQAQFATDLQQMREVHAEETKQIREVQAKTENIIGRLASASFDRLANLEEKISALVDSHVRLADAQAHTDERLGAFITTVERYISEGRNGRTQG